MKAANHLERYFPEIDGFRAIAVVAVFLFHLNTALLPGGFVGVDIFFVISGYLITKILLKDIYDGTFSILRFYQRRIARIAPASLLVIVVTIIAGYFFYSAQDLATVGLTGALSATSLVNFYFAFRGSYFAISPDTQPLLHYWSLAVEEQFYLLFPIFLVGAIKFAKKPELILIGVAVVSFAACVIITEKNSSIAFYLLPTRAWELLAGSCLALFIKQHRDFFSPKSSTVMFCGLCLTLLSFALIDEFGFPGWKALLPVIAATMVLAGVGSSNGMPSRFLSHPIMTYVGKLSFSLYLWHWPIFSFVDYHLYLQSPLTRLLVKVSLAVILPVLTYHHFESPARAWLNSIRKPSVEVIGFILVTVAVVFGGYLFRTNYYLSAWPRFVAEGGIEINPKGKTSVVLIGDSTAVMYAYELASIARAFDFHLNILAASGSKELLGEPGTIWPQVDEFLKKEHPKIIIVAQAWSYNITDNYGVGEFRRATEALESRAASIILLTQPPEAPKDATRQSDKTRERAPVFEESAKTLNRERVNSIIRQNHGSEMQIVDVYDIFLNRDNSIKLIAPDGRFTYFDSRHLSNSGAALVRPRIEEILRSHLAVPAEK